MIVRTLVAAAALLATTTLANATADGCAIVRDTPDDFLNLRQAPTATSLAILKLNPGWRLTIDTASCETSGTVSICGGIEWTHVTSVEPLDGVNSERPMQGWVVSRFLKFVPCPED